MTTQLLVLGDTHIPDRALRVPVLLERVIESGKPWDIVVFTGDLTESSVASWVKSLGRQVYIVRGNMDYLPLPKTAVFEVEDYRMGVHHGDGVYPRGDLLKLSKIASSIGVNVLFTGHTHSDFVGVSRDRARLVVNPGSLTGVWGGGGGSYIPSFAALTVEAGFIRVDTYKLAVNRVTVNSVCVWRIGGVFNLGSCN